MLNPVPGVVLISPLFLPFGRAGSTAPKKSPGNLSLFVNMSGTPSQLTSLRPPCTPGAVFRVPSNSRNPSSDALISPAALKTIASGFELDLELGFGSDNDLFSDWPWI